MRSQSECSFNEGNKQEKHVSDFAEKKVSLSACDQKT